MSRSVALLICLMFGCQRNVPAPQPPAASVEQATPAPLIAGPCECRSLPAEAAEIESWIGAGAERIADPGVVYLTFPTHAVAIRLDEYGKVGCVQCSGNPASDEFRFLILRLAARVSPFLDTEELWDAIEKSDAGHGVAMDGDKVQVQCFRSSADHVRITFHPAFFYL